ARSSTGPWPAEAHPASARAASSGQRIAVWKRRPAPASSACYGCGALPELERRAAAAARRGPALLVVSSVLFGAMALAAKRATLRLPGPEVAFVRFLVGLGAVAVAAAAGVRLRPVNWWGLALRGIFGGLAVLLYFGSIAKLPVGEATLLNYTAPLFT